MKRCVILLAAAFVLSLSMSAQKKVTVEAANDEISDNLDLKAIGIIFGKAKNLEEFEEMINDWRNPISNLDLNYDGEVDYLRVLESSEGKTHIIVIQAVLAPDIYQDVATLIATKKKNKPVVQIIGDPYIYGVNYIVEPVYIYTPVIYNWFWGPAYVRWYSPYYWGYYPVYYRNYYCVSYDDYYYYLRGYYSDYHYVSYRYADRPRYEYRESRIYRDMSRRDYNTRYPDRSFSSRNSSRSDITNRRDIERTRSVSGDYRSDRQISRRDETGTRTIDNRTARTNRDNSSNERISTTREGRSDISNERVSTSREGRNGTSRDRISTTVEGRDNSNNRTSITRESRGDISNDRTSSSRENRSDMSNERVSTTREGRSGTSNDRISTTRDNSSSSDRRVIINTDRSRETRIERNGSSSRSGDISTRRDNSGSRISRENSGSYGSSIQTDRSRSSSEGSSRSGGGSNREGRR